MITSTNCNFFKKFLVLVLCVLCINSTSKAQIDYTIGNGTTPNTCTSYPTPYSQWFESSREQFLFLASELTAAGMGPGVITGIKWNVTSLNNGSCTYASGMEPGFTIKMGTTNVNTLTGWVAGISTPVYGPTNTQPVVGINAYPLPAPFIWNGTDNIVVEVCQGNGACLGAPSGYTSNASVNMTTLTFNGSIYYISDCSGNLCATTSAPTTTTSRPNTIFTYGKPCTGVPVTEVAGPNLVCPNKPFNLGFTNFFSGITVQWQISYDGITWTNFTGTVNPISGQLSDAISQDTWYRCVVKCTASTLSYTTMPHLVKIAPFYYCYCITGATATAGADVGNVLVNALPSNAVLLNNGVATPLENNIAANKGYSYFSQTLPPVPMYRDSLYKITVSQTNSATFVAARTAVYIDANRNGTFDDSERVINQPSLNVLPNPGVVTLPSYKLPTWAVGYGLTGMRVIIKAGTTDPDTCGAYTNGETEDYVVDMRMIPCNGKPNPGVILGDTSMCNGYKYVLTDTTVQKDRHGIDHYWQLSADGVNWNDIPGSLNKDTLTRIFNIQPLYYRVVATCSHTNDTAYTPAHKVNIKPGYKCYCFSQSTGTNEDTSDIGSFKIAKFEVTDKGTHLLNPKALRERTDYTDLPPIEIDVDSVYNFYVFHTMPYNNHADGKITVFVDFDNDKQYDIPEERIYTGFTSIGNHVKLGTLMIPNNVIVNMPTGLRIVINNDVAPNPASDEGCGTYQSGETEDFIVLFSRPFGVSVKEAEGVNQLSLVPNPTNGVFQVQFKGAAAEQVTVKVTTVTGQVVKQEVYPHSGGIFRQAVDMGNQPKGVYMVEVSANGQKMMQKLVLQ